MSNGNDKKDNNNHGNNNDSEPTPLSRRDYEQFREAYDSVHEVKNSMPPPPNPNRGGGQKDE